MYTFNGDQLNKLLAFTIELSNEYIHTHGYSPEMAKWQAVFDTLDGLDSEKELFQAGEVSALNQQLTKESG